MDFGEKDGLHFDGLTEAEKAEFSQPDYKAPGGESWPEVRSRVEAYLADLESGQHLLFTHGGPIVNILQDLGVDSIPSNGSVFAVTLDEVEKGRVKTIDFEWQFPVVTEDI